VSKWERIVGRLPILVVLSPEDKGQGPTIKIFAPMLAITAGAFLLVTWVATKELFFFLQKSPLR